MKLYKVTIDITFEPLEGSIKHINYVASENLIDVIEEFPDAITIKYIDEIQVI